jgi:L-threonylcarbamoyladenylate synthase
MSMINMTAEILKNGGIVVAPSETKYGMLGRIDRAETIDRLYKLKKRPKTAAVAVFVKSRRDISNLACENKISKKLSDRFLPGPLTLVLKDKSGLAPPIVMNGKIGIRYSSSELITKILSAGDYYLTATSANISGCGDLETIDEIVRSFGTDVDLYLDSGCLNTPPSTVVECLENECLILREGAISKEKIMKSIEGN